MFFKKHISKLSDAELLQSYRHDGKSEWLGELYQRYSYLVFGVCLKYLKDENEARDATLGIFEKLMDTLLVQDVYAFQPWLHRVTKNHCLMALRYQQQHAKRHNSYMHVVSSNNGDETEEMLLAEWKENSLNQLEHAIEKLKGEQRECVSLFYLKEKSYIEITESTGYSLGEVKSYIQNGKRNLRTLLTGTE
ncbi:MAG: RNA polymerase sigma factor [Flavobacteriales bacterium]